MHPARLWLQFLFNSNTTLGQIGVWHVDRRKENEEKYPRQNESKRNF